MRKTHHQSLALLLLPLLALAASAPAAEFRSDWPDRIHRTWVGHDFWANRLQDWRISDGRLECLRAAPNLPMRTVHLLTHRLASDHGLFTLSVQTGLVDPPNRPAPDAAAGFLIGAGGPAMDYRSAALIHHNPGPGGGLFAGIDADGSLFFQSFEAPLAKIQNDPRIPTPLPPSILLQLSATPHENGTYTLTLTAADPRSGQPLARAVRDGISNPIGNVALVSHPGTGQNPARFWFRDWTVSGPKVNAHPDAACGPILCTQYTVHNQSLKLTAQLMPLSPDENRQVQLQTNQDGQWKTIATTRIIIPGHTAPFRVEEWDSTRDIPYRVLYQSDDGQAHSWSGTIKRDPVEKETIVLAGLSCVQQVNGSIHAGRQYRWTDRIWFPHADMTPNVAKHAPDVYFFAGDQIYEGNPTPAVKRPVDQATLDYLYKWYLWCWAFRDLVKDTPCITIPDDHDVYHGNIWGMGGKPAAPDDPNGLKGGYALPPEWLNMMQRTQSSHLPDPYDPTPVEQGITVYYTTLNLGRIGFAILEDRKWKSSPAIVDAPMTPDSHITDPDFDIRKADVPGASLLGERQLRFLHEFSRDWTGHDMKAALSQTIFCNLQISSRPPTTGQLDKDLDSNGWPQTGRAKALRELRRGFAFHIAGDQHLASVIHHGVDEFEDSIWSLCVPSIANFYTRFWNPAYPPLAPSPRPDLPFTGRYLDGFHNKLTVHAIANPTEDPAPGQFPEPVELHRKAPGYAIVRFHKPDRTITMEVWPRYADPLDPATGRQYPGWPITIRQTDNYGRPPAAHLPLLRITGPSGPVVQVIDDAGEILYTLRISGSEFRPKVFKPGAYTINVSHPETGKLKTLGTVRSVEEGSDDVLEVEL